MDQALKEYIASLKPEGFPDGNALVKRRNGDGEGHSVEQVQIPEGIRIRESSGVQKEKSGGGKADIPAADGTFDAGRRTRGH